MDAAALSLYDRSTSSWTERARKVIPGGACTLSKRPGFAGPEGCYPAFVDSAFGCNVGGVDDKAYIDWTSALGASTLGYRAVEVCAAITSLPDKHEILYAERLVDTLPGVEQVKFASSGTEVCMAAVATARAATGRTNPGIIVTSDQSYHGWSDLFRAIKALHPGVPDPMKDWIRTFRYNNLPDLERVLRENRGQVAAVMMEPCLAEPPDTGFLPMVKRMAHGAGALFILDEMLLGGRMAWGGGTEYFGRDGADVIPDLATYGKAFGGGYPLGILAGTADAMQHSLFMSGTFCGHPLAMKAGLYVQEMYIRERVIERLWSVGSTLMQLLEGAIARSGAPLEVVGYPILPILKWTTRESDTHDTNLCHSLLQQELADRGVLIHASGRLLPTVAHDEKAIIQTAIAFRQALESVVGWLKDGTAHAQLRGVPIKEAGVRKPAWEVSG